MIINTISEIYNWKEASYKIADVANETTYRISFIPDGTLSTRMFIKNENKRKFLIPPVTLLANNNYTVIVKAPISGELMLENRSVDTWEHISNLEVEELQ